MMELHYNYKGKEYLSFKEARILLHCTNARLRSIIARDRLTNLLDEYGEKPDFPSKACWFNKQEIYDFIAECGVNLSEDDELWDKNDIKVFFDACVAEDICIRARRNEVQTLIYTSVRGGRIHLFRMSDVYAVAKDLGIEEKTNLSKYDLAQLWYNKQ